MPLPPIITGPYDTAETALNIARALANDVGQSVAGSPLVLGDTAPGTFVYLNLGWRRLQIEMTNNGIGNFEKTIVIPSLPVAATADPGIFCYLNYAGFFNGVALLTPSSTPAGPTLPPDMMGPLRLWERASGQMQSFSPMFQATDGLPQRSKTLWLREWNWEQEQINLVGANQVNDLQLRCNRFLPDIQPDQAGLGTNPIPLLRCAHALGAFTAAAFGLSRGSQIAADLDKMGVDLVKQMMTTTQRQKQHGNHRRQPYSGRVHGGWGFS